MAAELYRHTDKPERVDLFRKDLRACHLPASNSKRPRIDHPIVTPAPVPTKTDLWGDDFALATEDDGMDAHDFDLEQGDKLLSAAGFF